jgi:hypothetical protein
MKGPIRINKGHFVAAELSAQSAANPLSGSVDPHSSGRVDSVWANVLSHKVWFAGKLTAESPSAEI